MTAKEIFNIVINNEFMYSACVEAVLNYPEPKKAIYDYIVSMFGEYGAKKATEEVYELVREY